MPDPDSSPSLPAPRDPEAARMLALAMHPATRPQSDIPSAAELGALLPDYAVEEIIGRGGMGAVYRAMQRNLARAVAIKVMPVELGDTPGFADRFRQEAMTTAGLAHPDIVAVHDAGETVAGHLYYIMDLVDGEDLAERMERGQLPPEECVALLATVCGAVEAAHAQGIIHRDIKPSNILLTKDGKPKLADFGLALLTEKHLEYSRLTLGGTTLGTLEYAAPEQLAGTGASAASDQYSLGVLAYELLTGELPRGVFEPPSARNTEIDPAFDGVILRALQSDPARRYASVAEFREAILHAADRRVQQARRDSEARHRLRQRTRFAAAAAAVALLTVGLAVAAWWQSRRAADGEAEANRRRAAAEAAERETEGVIQFLLTDLRAQLEKTGNLGAMESVLERAVQHFRGKHEAAGHAPETAVQLADALTVKAEVLAARALPEEGVALFSEAIELIRQARDAAPQQPAQQPAQQLRLVQAWRRRCEQLLAMGKYQESLADADQMLLEAEMLPPATRTRAVATAHMTRANVLGYLKKLDDCRTGYLRARELLAAEMKSNPGSRALTAEHAALDMSLGSLAEEQKDYPRMLQHFTAWHDSVKAAEGTDTVTYSHAAVRLALALVLNQRAAEALPLLADAVRIAEAEVEDRPGHRGNLGHLRWCLDVCRKAQERRGEHASAAEYGRRIAALDVAIAAAPEEDAAGTRDRIADRLQQAEQTRFAALKADPENDAAQFAWAMASEDLGKHTEATLGIEAAVRHYQRQMAKLEVQLASAPADTWWKLGASYTLNRLGEIRERTRAWTEAEPVFRRSLSLRRETRAAHPGNPRDSRNIASTAARLARTFIALGRAAEAETLWRELMAELAAVPGDTGFEWRALLAASIPETMAALSPEAARSLRSAARDFLLLPGPDKLSASEKESLAALDQAAP